MNRVFALAVLAMAAAGAAYAQKEDSGRPPHFWAAAEDKMSDAQAEGMPDSNLVRLGKLAVQLDSSPLENIASTMGQPAGHAGDAGDSISWICLHIDGEKSDTRLWLSSSEVAGGNVDAVALQRYPATAKQDSTCPAIKPAYAAVVLPGDVHLGLSEAALRQQLGKPGFDKNGLVGFARSYDLGVPESKGGPCELAQRLWAKIEDGAVAALSFSSNGVC